MKDIKKLLAGAMALTITAGLSACTSEDGGDAAETTTAEVTTTPAITTDINTETLAAEEADVEE